MIEPSGLAEIAWLALARSASAEALAAAGAVGLVTVALAFFRRHRAPAPADHGSGDDLGRRIAHRNAAEALRQASDAVLLIDEAGWIVSANERAAAMYGRPLAELERLHSRDLDAQMSWSRAGGVEAPRAHAEGILFEAVHQRADGTSFPVEVSSRDLVIEHRTFRQKIVRDISQRRAAEMAVRESETRYRELFENAGDVLGTIDLDLRLTSVNRLAEETSGLSRREIVGRSVLELLAPEDDETVRGAVARLLAGEDRFRFEASLRTRDGRTVPVEVSPRLIRVRGEPREIQIVARDLSERRRAEQALREAEERWRFALEGAGDAVWEWWPQKGRYHVSPRLRQMLGWDPCDETSMGVEDWRALVHPDDLPAAEARVRDYLGGEVPDLALEYRMLAADGTYRWILTRGRVTERDAEGRPARIIGTQSDIQARKENEARVALWSRVFESTNEGILITDLGGNILAVNPAFTTITGYSQGEVAGRNPRLMASGRHGPDFFQEMWEALLTTGAWSGEIWNRRKSGEVFPEWLSISAVRDGEGQCTQYIGVFADISERKEAEEEIWRLSHHDALTGLPNRQLLDDRLRKELLRCARAKQRLGLLVVNLDRFKNVNDSLGHLRGDELLQQVARRLQATIRPEDTVARTGGDEFALMVPGLHAVEDAARVAERCLASLAGAFAIGGHDLTLSASIGIALFPEDGAEALELERGADTALHDAKAVGPGSYRFATHDLTTRAFDALYLEGQLRRALERDELHLVYQPQYDVTERRIVGLEALLRWQHPELGAISPGRFIPIAEERGLIGPIGEWVLRAACRQSRRWRDAGLPVVPVAINLSASQFRSGALPSLIAAALAESGLAASCLEVELTESTLMHGEAAVGAARTLAAMGIGLAIDDFGTGYSSLAYLRRLPLTRLKIDQSFVREIPGHPDGESIVRAIVGLAKNLRLRVLAEGVETAQQLEFLEAAGCDEAQGFHLARPMLPAEVERLLAA